MAVDKLNTRFLEKVWGSPHLSPWFPDSSSKIGEAWFEAPDGTQLPLLVKFIFTTERLSIQVHPGDDYAALHHQANGKTEMWHILRADPGAQVALGLRHALASGKHLREASESGEILDLMNWIDVKAGDTFFVPAGTIHAIGAGLAICEIQQFSDVTYRLYDYGRPRELHLDDGVAVSDLGVFAPIAQPPGWLVRCKYFNTDLIEVHGSLDAILGPAMLVAIDGAGTLNGTPFRQGEAWRIESDQLSITGPARFLRASV